MRLSIKNDAPNSEGFYAAIFDNIGLPVLIIDSQTAAILDVNEAACTFYGYSYPDFIQKKILDLAAIPMEEAWQRIRKIATGEITHMTLPHRLANGEIREVAVDLGHGEFGGKVVNIATVHDVTEREQAKKKLQESEERYHSLFENMREGFSLQEIIQDETGRVVDFRVIDANPAYERHTGQKLEEIIGRTIREIMPNADTAMIERYGNVALTGEPLDFEYYSKTFNRYIHVRSFQPKPNYFASIFEDITEHKQVAAALQAAHDEMELRVQERTAELRRTIERLDLATDAAKMGIWDWDIQKNELIWDRQMYALYDVKPEDFGGAYEAWLNGIHPDDRETSDQASEQARKGEIPYDTEFRILWPDGSIHWLKADGQVFWDEQGKPTRMLGVNYDITERKQADVKLSQSEERFRALFENSAITMLLIEPSTGKIVNANPAAATFYGYSHEILCSMNIKEINQLTHEEVLQEMQQAKEGKRNYFIFPHRLANGENRTVEVRSNPIVIDQNTLLYSFIYDVTEKIENEKRMHENQFRAEMAIRGGNVGTWEWNVQTGETVFNERWAEIVGYTLKELEPISIQTWIDLCHPDDLKLSDELLNKYFIGESKSYECELRVKHKDGSWVWVIDSGWVMDRTADGKPLHMFGTHLDITERKQAEEMIRQSEVKYTTLFEKSAVPTVLFRLPEIVVEGMNKACEELIGFTRKELFNKNIAAMKIAPQAQYSEIVATFFEQGSVIGREARIITKSGAEHLVLLNIIPLTFSGQSYAITTFVDITARKQAEAQLAETNIVLEKALRAKDEFMAAMSHELRTPLNGIMGMADLLQMTAANTLSEKQLNYLTVIEKSGQRLSDMINKVLEYTQLQTGTLQLDIRTCTLDESCKIALQKIAPLAKLKQQQIRCSINPPDIKVSTDAIQFHKILLLLLDNASKFTATGGEFGIEIMGKPETGLVEITVWDTGIGIADVNLPRLFKPFAQLDASLARQYEGSGLGLALAKGLAELLGGNLTVQSILDKGSRFTITLPWK